MDSDLCSGQNRNSIMSSACIVAVQNSKTLTAIGHKFLAPGHTHIEWNTHYSLIEEKKKKSNKIEQPHIWVKLMTQIENQKPVRRYEMERQDFLITMLCLVLR